jgi:hypothetical protein
MVGMYVPDQAFRTFNDRLIVFARTQRLPMTCSAQYGCTLDGRGMRRDVVPFSRLADGRREFDAFLYPSMFWRASPEHIESVADALAVTMNSINGITAFKDPR